MSYLRPGLSLEEALRKSRKDGLQYGITAEASTLKNDVAVDQWLAPMAHQPVFFALAADNSTWTEKLSQSAARKFDYVIADVHGASMDTVLIRLQKEPIDILSGLGPVPKEREKRLNFCPGEEQSCGRTQYRAPNAKQGVYPAGKRRRMQVCVRYRKCKRG